MRVVIITDIRLYREGLADVLGRYPEIDVVGTAADGEVALDCVGRLRPDVALLDMAMLGSTATMRALAATAPEVKVVALGVPEVEPHILACAEAGVAAYVPREGSLDDLVVTLKGVAVGEVLCSPHIVASLFRRLATLALERPSEEATRRLTVRETEILKLVDEGLTNKEIGRRLCIELPTVKNHIHNILEKLQLGSRSEAAAWMRRRTAVAGSDLRDSWQVSSHRSL
jgi:two-component system nitrate/nitrite response regulator NarL